VCRGSRRHRLRSGLGPSRRWSSVTTPGIPRTPRSRRLVRLAITAVPKIPLTPEKPENPEKIRKNPSPNFLRNFS
jgi:hypothetical protein